jgi:triosephosphate isomerase
VGKLSIDQIDVNGKRVIVRSDFNVPLNEKGEIVDDKRIKDALPTLWRIIVEHGKLILVSHMGRPKGKIVPSLSLKPVAERLSELLNTDVILAPDCIGEDVEKIIDEMEEGDVVLLENTRFHKEDTTGDKEFAKKIAKLGDVFVNNAFGIAHRAHASVSVLANEFDQVAAGYLMMKEMKYIGETMKKPKRPFAAILAGVKVDGKIDVINKFLEKADKIFVAGGIANTMLLAKGYEVGNSIVEKDKIEVANDIFKKVKENNLELFLPIDMKCGKKFKNDTEIEYVDVDKIGKDQISMGIGPKTLNLWMKELEKCKTAIWNGPVSVFEFPNFAEETFILAKFIADQTKAKKLISIIGGGDTAAAVKQAGDRLRFSHISTGGGAALEYMSGKKLPGIEAISDIGFSTERRFVIAGNWKMNKNVSESLDFVHKLKSSVLNDDNIDIIVAPAATSLHSVNEVIRNSHIELSSQDIFYESEGAYTGEISASMLLSCGVRYTIIGHSERRQYFGDTDEIVNKKVKQALAYRLKPIICLGETLEEREAGKEKQVIKTQFTKALEGIEASTNFYIIIAYEPVWAIGTGKTATPEQAEEIHAYIRELLTERYSEAVSKHVRILYGGSVKPDNAYEIFSQKNIDGGLIGGAALKVRVFTEIARIAQGIKK